MVHVSGFISLDRSLFTQANTHRDTVELGHSAHAHVTLGLSLLPCFLIPCLTVTQGIILAR